MSMLIRKGKIIIFCLLFLLGAALLIYGVYFHSTSVTLQQADSTVKITKSEPALIEEVSVGGIKLDKTGKIKQTYTGKAPKACPT